MAPVRSRRGRIALTMSLVAGTATAQSTRVNLVIENVSQVRICWEQCDYFRIQCSWALELDDIATDATRP